MVNFKMGSLIDCPTDETHNLDKSVDTNLRCILPRCSPDFFLRLTGTMYALTFIPPRFMVNVSNKKLTVRGIVMCQAIWM